MKKIPTLFVRKYDEKGKSLGVIDEVTPGLEWVLDGEGTPTIKLDGSCCAIINGELYKRYDAKHGKKAPDGAIPCCEPDPITGHWPHWIKIDPDNKADKWFVEALNYVRSSITLEDGTYEAVGPHFNSNKYNLKNDTLILHGVFKLEIPDRSFDSLFEFLSEWNIEGIVFWKDGEPICKIKRSDFGLVWPDKEMKSPAEEIIELAEYFKGDINA